MWMCYCFSSPRLYINEDATSVFDSYAVVLAWLQAVPSGYVKSWYLGMSGLAGLDGWGGGLFGPSAGKGLSIRTLS